VGDLDEPHSMAGGVRGSRAWARRQGNFKRMRRLDSLTFPTTVVSGVDVARVRSPGIQTPGDRQEYQRVPLNSLRLVLIERPLRAAGRCS
jgi:hypothetical protein